MSNIGHHAFGDVIKALQDDKVEVRTEWKVFPATNSLSASLYAGDTFLGVLRLFSDSLPVYSVDVVGIRKAK